MSNRTSSWSNWAGNERCRARRVRPGDIPSLRRELVGARGHGRVRFLGAGASWSRLVPTDGTLIDLGAFAGVRAFDADADPPTVRVGAGTSIGALVDFLAGQRLMLRSPTVFHHVSVGGAIATGSHGSGLGSGGLSDDVLSMTMVCVNGDVVHLDEGSGDAFRAAQVGLGALGAVVEVTLRCERQSNVLVEDRFMPLARVIDGLDDLVQSAPSVELYWFPFAEWVLVKSMTPVDEAVTPSSRRARMQTAIEHASTLLSGRALLPLVSRTAPVLTRLIATLTPIFSSFREGVRVDSSLDAHHYQRAYPPCQTMSFGVPLARAAAAFEHLVEIVEHDGRRGRYGVNMVAHARFIGGSRAFLAQSHGGPTCDLEVVTSMGVPHAPGFYDAFACAMYDIEGARPHWGKLIVRPERIASRYPKMAAFLEQRERFDPDRMLLNDFLEREVFALGRPTSSGAQLRTRSTSRQPQRGIQHG